MSEKVVPIMNRGWQVHETYEFLGQPYPRAEDASARITGNKLWIAAQGVYNFMWLLHYRESKSEGYLLNHCGKNIILTRETGIIGLGGDYEYALPNFQQPKAIIDDLLMRVHTTPEILEKPEPNLLYIKLSNVNLRNPHSGIIHFYDPISGERLALNLVQYEMYLTGFDDLIGPYIKALLAAEKNLSVEQRNSLIHKYVSQSILTAILFAPLNQGFERILQVVFHYRAYGFDRIWQFFTVTSRDKALHLNNQLLYNLYPHEVLHREHYEKRKPIDY